MAHKIQIAYSATAITNVAPATLQTAMAAVVLYTSPTLDPLLCQGFGLTVASDVTSIAMLVVTRTITLNMDPGAVGGPTPPSTFPVLQPATSDAPGVVYSSNDNDTVNGSGAQQVQVSYKDAEGNAGVSLAALAGRTPVTIPLAGGTNGVASVTSIVITRTGALGANFGQITVEQELPLPPNVPVTRDVLERSLGLTLAYVPNGFYSLATPPGSTTPTPAQLQALVTNLFTNTLQLALATAITAAVPVLI